jgi:hypothetical protein
MHLTGLDLLFWAAGLVAHLTLLFVLLVCRRVKMFPIFTSLIAVNVGRTIALMLVGRHWIKASYFYTFWSFGILDTLLELLVVYEMYAKTFRPHGAWAPDLRRAFSSLMVLTISVATALTWLAAPPARVWMQVIVIKGNFFSAVSMSELFVGMIALSVKVGLPWKTHVARISQGLGVYSLIDVLIETGHSYFGAGPNTEMYTTLSHVRMSAYLCCVAYWIVMLWSNAPGPRKMPKTMRGQLIQLQYLVDSDLERLRVRRRW